MVELLDILCMNCEHIAFTIHKKSYIIIVFHKKWEYANFHIKRICLWLHYSIITAFGRSWRLQLEWCERKILLPGWWLEAGAGVMREGKTVALEGWRPAEHSE